MSYFTELLAEYREVLESVKKILADGCLRAAHDGNQAITETYYEIGREISALVSKHEWDTLEDIEGLGDVEELIRDRAELVPGGEELVWDTWVHERLSEDLQAVGPGSGKLSASDFRCMMILGLWPGVVAQQPIAQLPWDSLKVILTVPYDGSWDTYAQLINDLLRNLKTPLERYYPPAGTTSPSIVVGD